MDQRGNIHDLNILDELFKDVPQYGSEEARVQLAKLQTAMEIIPEPDEERVRKMNRKARRAWFAAQRRKGQR